MELNVEVDLSAEEAKAIARGMLAVARSDGKLDPRELVMIQEFYPASLEALPDMTPKEAASALENRTVSGLFLKSCLLVAWADREYSDKERALISKYAEALAISAAELAHIEQSVKEWLMAPLSRLANTEAVVEVSKKMGA